MQEEEFIGRFDKVTTKGKGRYMARCPAHDDRSPSLSLLFNHDGRILIHCFAGCEASDVLTAIGMSLTDMYPDGPIREFMSSTNKRVKSKNHTDETILWICKCKREQGERLTDSEMESERQAFLRTRRRESNGR